MILKRSIVVLIALGYTTLAFSSGLSIDDTTKTKKHCKYGVSLFNTVIFRNKMQNDNTMGMKLNKINQGIGIYFHGDHALTNNLSISLGAGLSYTKFKMLYYSGYWDTIAGVGVYHTTDNIFKTTDIYSIGFLFPLYLKYAFPRKNETKKINYFIHSGVIRNSVLFSHDNSTLPTHKFLCTSGDVLKNIFLFKRTPYGNLNNSSFLIDLGMSYRIKKQQIISLSVEYLRDGGSKYLGLLNIDLFSSKNYIGLKADIVF